MNELKLLFVGESWLGSSSTSLKEALRRIDGIVVDEVNEDFYFPRGQGLPLRLTRRLLSPFFTAEFKQAVERKCREGRFDAVVIYKGAQIDREFIGTLKKYVPLTVNVFPDYSPHVYGPMLSQAMGAYDLVISVKRFHPQLWNTLYGYSNECAHVPHGYNPKLHLVDMPATQHASDVVLVATWRAEYEEMLQAVASKLRGKDVSFIIAGGSWAEHAGKLPADWKILPAQSGHDYVNTLRSGRITLAPLHQRIRKDAPQHQGDEDTGRSYELAAAYCFFLHQRNDFIKTQYDEDTEVPMFDGTDELSDLILKYRSQPHVRRAMADAAHRRAVPAYSRDTRAAQTVAIIRQALAKRGK